MNASKFAHALMMKIGHMQFAQAQLLRPAAIRVLGSKFPQFLVQIMDMGTKQMYGEPGVDGARTAMMVFLSPQ